MTLTFNEFISKEEPKENNSSKLSSFFFIKSQFPTKLTEGKGIFSQFHQPKYAMTCLKLVLIGFLFSYLHSHHDFMTFVNGGKTPAAPNYLSDIAINCGSLGDSSALDGREWVGEAASNFMSGKSRSSTAAGTSFDGADPVPYKTSRISATEFRYTFTVNPGQKFIRLHFYPASYRGFEKSMDYFCVKAGPFTLLRDYSASLAADTLGVKYIVKEFCLNVEENVQLNITFSPSSSGKSKNKVYAFVNGIDIISMPPGLYYTPEHELGARIVGLSNRFHIIDNSTALEVIQRFNIGGRSIPPVEDFGMFRQWDEDTNYLLEPRACRVNHQVLKIKYTNTPAFVAPPKIYQTSWKLERSIGVNQMYNFVWKVPIDLGYGYLLRLHFCQLDAGTAEREPREFSVHINNQIVETKADVIRWSGDIGTPVYRDYVVKMKGDRESSKSDLFICLQSVDELVFGLLNGLEIFKLSNLDNSLAAANLVFPERLPTFGNREIENLFLVFGQSNVIGTAMTALIILFSAVTYNLRKIWEDNFHDEKYAETASVESSCRCFSLVEIKLATQNFSDAFVIGSGGFGKVYKGFIPGVSKTLAIKRLNSHSMQGACEFWSEIDTLSKRRHIHLLSLIGYCNEFCEMILVYEYMQRGTLADNLYKFAGEKKGYSPLSWEQRLRICIGAARGLEYLHTGSDYGVIHRDVKDTNILLDENFVSKISDFGLSKLERMTSSKNYVSTQVKGTFGYLDPAYFRTHRLTRKSDVYAFGVVMLVVLSGRPAVDTIIPGEPQSLLLLFQDCVAEGDVNKIVDPDLQGKISSNGLREFVKIVESCLHHLPTSRPTMAQVVASLELALEQHESPTSAESAPATAVSRPDEEGTVRPFQMIQHETQTVEKSDSSAPQKGIRCKPIQNLASVAGVKNKNLQPRGKDHPTVQKPFWVWSWKAVLNRGYNQKAEQSFSKELPFYGYETLADATNNFDPEKKIRFCSFGAIYKGTLSNGQGIAVKRRLNYCHQGNMEFMNEVLVLSELKHDNLVRPIGCCVERNEKMLIYEAAANGNLASHLFDSKKRSLLDWKRRKIIIEGVARGLLYLHRDSRYKVIHRDLTASNILLDKELNPKISNFHLARIYRGNKDRTSRIAAGTIPYMALEYLLEGLISEKSDVYSYGVLLLEIISGKRCSDGGVDTNYLGLIGWARKLWKENETIKLVDPAILRPGIEMEILRYVHVGLLCAQESAMDMPDVSTLLSILKNDKAELPQPKLPAYTARMSITDKESFKQFGDSVNDVSSTTFEGR